MRLIDADALERHVYTEWVNGELSNSEWVDFRQWLKDEPTVEAVSPWHRVTDAIFYEDKPPDKKTDAIFYYEWTGISGTVYRETSIISLDELMALGCRPIAWMPLPEPPKEDMDGERREG